MKYPKSCSQRAAFICTRIADGYYPGTSSNEIYGICRACHKLCTESVSAYRDQWRSRSFIWYDSEQHYENLRKI